MKFHLPVYVGDQVSCFCETRQIGTTSISVHIETWVRRREENQEYRKVTEATYTYVAIGKNRKPVPIHLRESHDQVGDG